MCSGVHADFDKHAVQQDRHHYKCVVWVIWQHEQVSRQADNFVQSACLPRDSPAFGTVAALLNTLSQQICLHTVHMPPAW